MALMFLFVHTYIKKEGKENMYLGELISFGVAISWTATALFAEVASKRMGSLPLNVVRMVLSLIMLSLTLWLTVGTPYPPFTDEHTWLWLCLSGFVGYVLGDYCLFQSYILMSSRFGQLFMTLASPSAAIAAWILLGESMNPIAILGMTITLIGIGMSILTTGEDGNKKKLSFSLPLKGILFGIGAGAGQGIGLVLSKVGMEYYEQSIVSNGITDMDSYICPDAIIPISLAYIMPFASTMIRAIIGLIGFGIALLLFTHKGAGKLKSGITDATAMKCAIGAAFFGPFFGVSLSLLATLHTNTGIAQTIMSTTPVMIILPSWLLFHQKVTPMQVIGACISVIGVSLFFI